MLNLEKLMLKGKLIKKQITGNLLLISAKIGAATSSKTIANALQIFSGMPKTTSDSGIDNALESTKDKLGSNYGKVKNSKIGQYA